MGLYMNTDHHSAIYRNSERMDGLNQDSFKKDFLTDWKEEQQSIFRQQRSALENVLRQQRRMQAIQHQLMEEQSFAKRQHEEQDEAIREDMLRLFNKIKLEHIRLQAEFQQSIEQQWFPIWKSMEEMKGRLNHLEQLNKDLVNRLGEQTEAQHRMVEWKADYENAQQEVMQRLDNQEGLIDKIMRRLDHLRSIFFERTHFLAEKIEAGSPSSKQLAQGSERSLTLYKKNDTQEDQE
ncbi:hypothetical protein OXB_3467 [Bacillus sp. OxB-1]|uniref:hypothetical protein n=1 Tax=Bacillus sp. (strain OxB-1) TaxID=98228 RepID=UPI00058215C8|nr:hypothetical protein [Bacillus sp. OxB-1]BAQ11936.1 hypothetical protein OXB_3467 [Bacillus sp. OxB-1]